MANRNNQREQGGRAQQPDPDNSVEFCVKPAEDLVLEGTHKSLLRVRANTPYSCIMLKTQRFQSLFRHYAKHHGLDKETLVFFFTEELQNDDTPESVHMQRNDEIVVRTRKPPKNTIPLCPDSTFFNQMRTLLSDDQHWDVEFIVGPNHDRVTGHRAVLTARGDYFKALFRKGGMKESEEGVVVVENCSVQTLRRLLEWVYTNRVDGLSTCSAPDVIDLMGIAEAYLLTDLKSLCEAVGANMIDIENVSKLLCAADRYSCNELKSRCIEFVLAHADEVTEHPSFVKELQNVPALVVPIVRAAANSNRKRKRDA